MIQSVIHRIKKMLESSMKSKNEIKLNREEYLVVRLKMRVQQDIQKKDVARAIQRFEGFLYSFPNNQEVLMALVDIYIERGEYEKAGKYLYLVENLNENQKSYVLQFEESLGNDPILILNKVIRKSNFSISTLTQFQKKKLKLCINKIMSRYGIIPKYLQGIEAHLSKLANEKKLI